MTIQTHPLSISGIGLACGITWALGVLALGLVSWLGNGYGQPVIELLGSVYKGYDATLIGSIVGTAWAFVDGFIGGAIFAWLYNKLS